MTIPGLRPISPEQLGHLDWCLPAFCETPAGAQGLEDGTLHYSAPFMRQLTGDDADVIMRLGQYGEVGKPFLEIQMDHRGYSEDTAITFTLSEEDLNWIFTGVHELRECR